MHRGREIVRTEDRARRGVNRVHRRARDDIEQTVTRVEENMRRVREADVEPTDELGTAERAGGHRRIDEHVDIERLQDAVGQAAGVVAPALVVQHRDRLGAALAIAQAELQRMGLLVVRVERLDRGEEREVEALLLAHDDLVPAAVERRSRLDAHEPVATTRRLVLLHAQPADHSPAVQLTVVMPVLVDEVVLLVGEVALEQQLAREVVVAGERADVARRTELRIVVVNRVRHQYLTLSRCFTRGPRSCRCGSCRRVWPASLPLSTEAGPIGVAPSVTPSCGTRADHRVEPDHRLEPDPKPRFDVFDVAFGVCRYLARDEALERAPALRCLAGGGRDEDGEAVRVDVERIPQRILRRLELRDADLGVGAELAAVHDPLAPEHRLIAEASGAELEPSSQLVVLENQRWWIPRPFGRGRGWAGDARRAAPAGRRRALAQRS